MNTVKQFMNEYFLHFNSRETVEAAEAYRAHIEASGKMLVSLAGAMSTARIGKLLSRMINEGYVHAISCTGANLEEDLFNLLENKQALLRQSKNDLVQIYTRLDNVKKNLPNESEGFVALGDALDQVRNAARAVQEVERSLGGKPERGKSDEPSEEPSEEPKVKEADIYGRHQFRV